MRFEVELWSPDPAGAAAVRATVALAPLSAELVEEGGRFFLVGSDFAAWAAEKQGYVKRVVARFGDPPDEVA